jgi:hypothetical protein
MDLWRTWHKTGNAFSWDVANYYSWLPAKFCNNNSFEFGNGVEGYLGLSPQGKHISRATYGMAIMYAPAFALGYKIAINQKDPTDGFSEPFATTLHWASILYVIIGLIFLRIFLLNYFSEAITALTLMIAFLGTMLFYYTLSLGEMPHGYLFFLISAFLLLCHKWHEKTTYFRSVLVGLVIGLISIIRPTEAAVVLIFIFYNVKTTAGLKTEALMFWKKKWHVLIMILIPVLIWIPQLLIWKSLTGSYFYNSYAVLGEKFYWSDPQILNLLFSYRKGWVVYTPLIILAFMGFFFMNGPEKKLRPVLLFILCFQVYLLSCWWDWFFGGSFGARGFSQHIAFLSIPIAASCRFFMNPENFKPALRILQLVFFVFVFSGIALNIGQTYQFNKNYIHFNSMTKKTYWLVFGKYFLDDEDMGKYWNSLKEPDYKKLKSGEKRDQ